jgi:hypothetical protein
MRNKAVAWASFETRKQAEDAIVRLERGGFARNSIRMHREPTGSFAVGVHTSERNLERVERLLHATTPMYAMTQRGSDAWQFVTASPVLIIGGAALAGFVAYALMSRSRRPTGHLIRKYPSRFAEMARDTARTVQETVQNALEEQHQTSRQPKPQANQAAPQPAPVRYPITPPTQPGKEPPSHPGKPAAKPG